MNVGTEAMDAGDAKGILSGILSLACRQLKTDPEGYRIKPGGAMIGKSVIDWYVTVQNVDTGKDVSRNTKEAKKIGLIKTVFEIRRVGADGPVRLFVTEWDAAKDWGGDYRVVLEEEASNMKARKKIAEMMMQAMSRHALRDNAS